MRSALLFSAVAIGSVAALNHKHAAFHRRNVAYDTTNVDWDKALSGMDWSNIDFANGKAKGTPAAPSLQPASNPQGGYQTPEPSSANNKPKPPVGTPASTTSAAAAPKKTPTSSGEIDEDVTGLATPAGLGPAINSKKPNGKMWLGSEGSDYQITFTNEASQDAGVICFEKSRMWNIKDGSLIFVKLKSGDSLTVSAEHGFSGGCGPVFKDSDVCKNSGIINDSILEFTAGKGTNGTFNISREVTMHGVVMSATGSNGCVSGMQGNELSCMFGCAGGASACGTAGSYNLVEGADTSGRCSLGEYNGQPEGGCQFGDGSEDIRVTFSDSRAWPSATIPKYAGEYAAKRR